MPHIDYEDAAEFLRNRGPRALEWNETPSLIVQGADTKICGPCCVGMALDIPVPHALDLMSSKGGGTRTSQMIAALGKYYKVPKRLQRVNKGDDLPRNGILKLTFTGRASGHWVLMWNYFIYDPGWGAFPYKWWRKSLPQAKARITSCLPIMEK